MESLKGRVKLPSPEDFVTEELDKASLEDLTPAEQVEKIDERASKEWKGLRLAMKYDMVGVAEHKGSLSKYVESKREVVAEVKDEEMPDVDNPSNVKQEIEEKKEEAMDIQNGAQ